MVISCRKILALLVGMVLLSSRMAQPVAESFVIGLNQPRGLAFDDAGDLFVAEAGVLSLLTGEGYDRLSRSVLRFTMN